MESVHEEWRPVIGFESLYEVSSGGQIRSLDRQVQCMSRWGGTVSKTMRGRKLSQYISGSGYKTVDLYINTNRTKSQVHRLVAAAFIGERPDMQVNHIDGNRLNNTPTNLEYMTPKDNIRHAIETGLMPCVGEDNPCARHTAEQIRKAYALVAAGQSRTEASRQTGVSTTAIASVCLGRKWKSLGLPVTRKPIGWNQFSKQPNPAGN